ncbi:lysM domain receptor-like kinase 4 [Cucumis melo var. makuwa]|uniref:LysM domain receptor-like kinase 4 n=1 Tax=Cucumis melo var. makuwa TaxID=1194695 RepID=A0A5A7U6Q1_CUCMM|nr:lysM domain receptor-like kinase 4 [Cucumis melo var. makuwa]TYK17247.1 lysM domain receptor-like kinase 4 [Cucumis melo var. makuwa]
MYSSIRYCSSLLFLLFFFFFFFHYSAAQAPDADGYTCSANQTANPCQAFVFYRASPPNFLDLAAIADLFWVSRLEISRPSNISDSNATFPLLPGQPLFIPITCSCHSVNASVSISYANLSYKINAGDNFWLVSTSKFQNLTTFQSVEIANPTLIPTNLDIGVNVVFPIFCKCPNPTQLQNRINFMVSYVIQPADTMSSIASRFGVQASEIRAANWPNPQPFETIFIPVSRLPNLTQPIVLPPSPEQAPAPVREVKNRAVTGLAIALGIVGFLLILAVGLWVVGVGKRRKNEREMEERFEKQRVQDVGIWKGKRKEMEVDLMADVSDCLDKYRVFKIEELNEATDGFSESSLIQGSVYKGTIGGVDFAIKKMKWNAYEQLKILQKVNHGNLVKLEGFCVDPEDATCYLIYEYVENGSLYSWLHESQKQKLNWRTRLRIAIDVANGLLYIHEHTRPQVVHKDVKSSNILLDANMRAKIANFGLAKSGCNAITMHIVGTQGYIAPEYIADGVVSTKMDIFSFGVVLLELISGKEAIDNEGDVLWMRASTEFLDGKEKDKLESLKSWIDEALFEQSCPMESLMDAMNVAVSCLQKDPTKRPSMVEVVYALSKTDEAVFDFSDDNLSAPPLTAR